MPNAAPTNRSSGHVDLMIGALPVQVSLYSATVSDHGVKRKQYVATDDGDHPVGSQNYDKTTGEVVAYDQIVKKIETEYGPVYVEDHEIEKLFEISPDTVVVKEFQPIALFRQGAYLPKGMVYIEPRKDKRKNGTIDGYSKASVKALNSLFESMRDKGVCAVVELTTRGTPKPAVLLPDGTLWLVHHTDEVREQRPLIELEPSEEDLLLFSTLIDLKYGTTPLDLTDERSALIQAFADGKASEGDFGKPEVVEVEKREDSGDDMRALLMASIEQAKAAKKAS